MFFQDIFTHIKKLGIQVLCTLFDAIHLFDFFEQYYFNTALSARSKMGTLPILHREKVDESYVLLSPFNTGDYKDNGGKIYFTDLYGVLLNVWNTKYQSSNTQFTKEGELYAALVSPDSKDTLHFPGGGRTGIIQKLNWDGEVLWEYKNPAIHHDFEVLPNGNLLLIRWEKVKRVLVQELTKNVINKENKEELWSDVVFEIDHSGEVVWEWSAQENLNPKIDMFGQFPYRVEWTHTNAVRYIKKNPVDGSEALLLSMRNTGRILLVRKVDGKIIWRSPENMFLGQHDPTMLNNGNILVFDNGLHRSPSSRSEVVNSRVIEINPKTDEIEWMLEGGRTSSEKARMYSSIMCGAQRLKNGNTHITMSPSGHLFEVTPKKELVWDYINPHCTHGEDLWPNNSAFNSRRYHKDEINWPVKLSSPLPKRPDYMNVVKKALTKIN